MIVITRNGERTVIKGWREWAILLPTMFLMALAMLVLFFLVLGITFTVMMLLLIGAPIAIVLVLLVQFFQRQKIAPRP
jgi:hypothetical protein